MTVSRRDFLTTGSVFLAGACLARRAAAFQTSTSQPPVKPTTKVISPEAIAYFDWKKAREGVQVAFGEGGNALVMVGTGGSLLIDTKNAGFGDTLRRESLAAGAPLAMVINTHHHADHTGGNCSFTADLPVLSHVNAKPRIAGNAAQYTGGAKNAVSASFKSTKMAAQRVKDEALLLVGKLDALKEPAKVAALFEPTKTTEGNETITVAGKKIELTHVGPGHTDNDLIVFLPEQNVLHTGDLLFHKYWPYMDRGAGCDSQAWIRSLERILAICTDKTVIVPGHGELADKGAVQAQIDFFKKMRDVAAKAVKDGTTRDDFLKLNPDEYKDYQAADRIRPVTLGALYDEAAGTPPPQPKPAAAPGTTAAPAAPSK